MSIRSRLDGYDYFFLVYARVYQGISAYRREHIRGRSSIHSDAVREPKQEEGHKRDLHALYLRYRHDQRAVCL